MASQVEVAQDDQETTVSGYCTITGKLYEVTVPTRDYQRWQQGELIQNVFPRLSADDREFLQTRTTPAEWDEKYGSEE